MKKTFRHEIKPTAFHTWCRDFEISASRKQELEDFRYFQPVKKQVSVISTSKKQEFQEFQEFQDICAFQANQVKCIIIIVIIIILGSFLIKYVKSAE